MRVMKGLAMKSQLSLIGVLSLAAVCVNAAEARAETCEQLKLRIQAQVGILTKTDTGLLQSLSGRQECRFSAAEIYRAAYGDKPIPAQGRRSHQKHDDHDH